ncbi:MAG: pyridoxamine 5'-phosphate oxidase [Bauldia sp.]|nr:pyridoxamine 5'-phosphate oxidase [Bauldia sp.]
MTTDFTLARDPISLFGQWLAEAEKTELNDPNAMSLATCDENGLPDVRIVLLKGHGPDGFVFFSNRDSAKGRELAHNPRAALAFHWKSLGRQVRIRGLATEVAPADADAYFQSRGRGSRIGAWASQQSRPLESRFALEKAVARETARFGMGDVPRPPYWTGWRVVPRSIEFWQDQPNRLHDRLQFTRVQGGPWTKARLYP